MLGKQKLIGSRFRCPGRNNQRIEDHRKSDIPGVVERLANSKKENEVCTVTELLPTHFTDSFLVINDQIARYARLTTRAPSVQLLLSLYDTVLHSHHYT